jgi:hypothetical protein
VELVDQNVVFYAPVRVLHAIDRNFDVVVIRVFGAAHEPRRTDEITAGLVVDVIDDGADGLVVVLPLVHPDGAGGVRDVGEGFSGGCGGHG